MLQRIYLFISSVVLALTFLLIGIGTFLLSWSQQTRDIVSLFINQNPVTLALFSGIFLILGCALLLHQLLGLKQRPYVIRSGPLRISVEPELLDRTLQTFCKERFPGGFAVIQSHVDEKHISVSVHLPQTPLEEQRPLLNQLEKDIKLLLAQLFGYRKKFELVASFDP